MIPEQVEVVFPQKLYKSVSAYDKTRTDRALVATVPKLSEKMIREREVKRKLTRRVERVIQFETHLARISETFDPKSSDIGSGVLGSWMQKLVLVKNSHHLPVKMSQWADEVETVLEDFEEDEGAKVIEDHMLWGAIRYWWANKSDVGEADVCAQQVFNKFSSNMKRMHIKEYLDSREDLVNKVQLYLSREGWASVSKELDELLTEHRQQRSVEFSEIYIENLFIMEPKKTTETTDIRDDVLEVFEIIATKSRLTAPILSEIQDLQILFRVHLYFILRSMKNYEVREVLEKQLSHKEEDVDNSVLEERLVNSLTVELGSTLLEVEEGEGGRSRREAVALLLLQSQCHREDRPEDGALSLLNC